MLDTDYIIPFDTLMAMEQYPVPKGGKCTANFFKYYTTGKHNPDGTLAVSGNGCIAKLQAFDSAVKTIDFPSIKL
ncbi:MAG: hypothetical protein RSB03_05170 [Oscillospiraceae bacterium]